MTGRDIFISHSSGDADVARALRAVLEAAGYSCWMAPDDIVGTETWTEQILGAIADSKAMIVLVSAASNRSPHVSREVNLALGKERAVLPIRIENVAPGGSLEYLLSLVQRVDAFPPPIADHGDRILRRLGTFLERQATATPPPGDAPVVPPPDAAMPPPAAAIPPPAAVVPPSIVVTPTSVVMPGISVTRPAPRSGPPMALLLGGGAAALVLVAVVGAGLLNPGASPTPSGVAAASQTAGSSTAPTAPEATVPATRPPLNANELVLQSILPSVAAGTEDCASWPTPPGGDAVLSPSGYAASTARLTCPGPGGGPPTEFALYATKSALDADYDAIMTSFGVTAGGACVSAIPANAPWSFPTYESSGNLACFERDGSVQYVWTQRELRVLGQWLAPDNATGLAFWQTWTKTLNPIESGLLADLPPSVDDLGACIRAGDRYYETALAILACPREAGQNSVFYARFTDASTFPDDPMTTLFDSILTEAGFPDDMTTGCYDPEPAFGRYTWGYNVDGTVGDTEGYLGCYERTDSTPSTAQYVWTANKLAVMGLWNAPDLESGIDFFDDWIGEIR